MIKSEKCYDNGWCGHFFSSQNTSLSVDILNNFTEKNKNRHINDIILPNKEMN